LTLPKKYVITLDMFIFNPKIIVSAILVTSSLIGAVLLSANSQSQTKVSKAANVDGPIRCEFKGDYQIETNPNCISGSSPIPPLPNTDNDPTQNKDESTVLIKPKKPLDPKPSKTNITPKKTDSISRPSKDGCGWIIRSNQLENLNYKNCKETLTKTESIQFGDPLPKAKIKEKPQSEKTPTKKSETTKPKSNPLPATNWAKRLKATFKKTQPGTVTSSSLITYKINDDKTATVIFGNYATNSKFDSSKLNTLIKKTKQNTYYLSYADFIDLYVQAYRLNIDAI
jgi:hypothetical protein